MGNEGSVHRVRHRSINPLLLMLSAFVVTHLAFGYRIYLDSAYMTVSALWFFLVLFAVGLLYNGRLVSLRPLLRSRVLSTLRVLPTAFSRQRRRVFKVFVYSLLLIGLTKAFYVAIYSFSSGTTLYRFRFSIDELVSPVISTPLDALVTASFPILLVLSIRVSEKGKSFSWESYLILALVVTPYLLSGSRSATFIFVWLFLFVAYVYSIYKLRTLGVVIIAGLFSLGAVGAWRLTTGGDLGHVQWYTSSGILIQGNLVSTTWNLLRFQTQDSVIRTYEIFQHVPTLLEYQHGKSLFFGFYSMLPGSQIDPSAFIARNIFGSTESALYPPTLVAQLYLDFGLLGVIVGPFLYSCFMWHYYYKLRANPWSYYYLSMYGILTYASVLALYGSFEVFRIFAAWCGLLVVRVAHTQLTRTQSTRTRWATRE